MKPAPLFLGIFQPEKLKVFAITQADALALYWFFRSVLGGWMKRAPQRNLTYFWVNYTHAANCLYTNPRAIQDSFDRLCGYYRGIPLNPGLQYPLDKIVIPSPAGKRCYFGINRDPFLQIVSTVNFTNEEYLTMNQSMNSIGLLEVDSPATGIKTEVQMILSDLTQIHQRGKDTPLVFSNRLPKPGGQYTKTLLQATKQIQSIYHGQFTRDCRVSPEFLGRNNMYITDETWTRLSGMKGSWEAVSQGVFTAAKNYRQWFWLEKEPESKEWLTRDISVWLYDRYNQSSLFLACLNGTPYPLRETKADRVYATLPNKIKKLAEEIYQKDWDSVTFWCKIRDIVEWYSEKSPLVSRDSNLRYWFENDLNGWFKKYIQWLQQFNGVYLKQIGINNPTWIAWCTNAAKEHGFSAKILE